MRIRCYGCTKRLSRWNTLWSFVDLSIHRLYWILFFEKRCCARYPKEPLSIFEEFLDLDESSLSEDWEILLKKHLLATTIERHYLRTKCWIRRYMLGMERLLSLLISCDRFFTGLEHVLDCLNPWILFDSDMNPVTQ